jgi:BRCA1-associated protein
VSDSLTAEKIEAIGIEYLYLLTSQLDSQQAFYEEQTVMLQANIASVKDAIAQILRATYASNLRVVIA